MSQLTIDFVSRRQNSKENQETLREAKPRLNRQCLTLLKIFESGRRLTVSQAAAGVWYNGEKIVIGDLRARCRDLLAAGYPIKKEKLKGGFKIYGL